MMQATLTTVPMIVDTLWTLASAILLLFGTNWALAMIKEKAITKSMGSYED
jgi:hypothetical protein